MKLHYILSPIPRQDWEEIADATLAMVLKTFAKKSGVPETKSSTLNAITPIASSKELARLKKRLAHAIERLDDAHGSDIVEIEATDGNDLSSA